MFMSNIARLNKRLCLVRDRTCNYDFFSPQVYIFWNLKEQYASLWLMLQLSLYCHYLPFLLPYCRANVLTMSTAHYARETGCDNTMLMLAMLTIPFNNLSVIISSHLSAVSSVKGISCTDPCCLSDFVLTLFGIITRPFRCSNVICANRNVGRCGSVVPGNLENAKFRKPHVRA